jgi:DNA ligase-1
MKEYSRKIYKLDTHGKVRVLHVYTEGADLVQESGLLEGEKITHRKTCSGKNIGRSNETTPEQQARAEAEAKVTDKMKSEYFDTIEEAKGGKAILPMLAEDYKKKSGKVDWNKPVYAQPKLDGQRCLSFITDDSISFVSRDNRPITTMEHITSLFSGNPKLPAIVLDGELYAHGLSFQENMKLIKKVRPGETEKVCYHVYDLISGAPFSVRYELLKEIVGDVNSPLLQIVDTIQIRSEADLKKAHVKNLADGYEGTIVRHGDTCYEINKRSTSLLKYKDFLDITAKITDVLPSDARPEQGVMLCEMPGLPLKTFKASLKFSHAERAEILRDKKKYIGKTAEIRFFEYTDDGLPRFPVCVGFRLDK